MFTSGSASPGLRHEIIEITMMAGEEVTGGRHMFVIIDRNVTFGSLFADSGVNA
ncbi:hypothetical protein L3V18_15995 [Lysobacter sp. TLK-CK17T]|uniref:Uncharacterized protein n=1 Tax=Marilutibacter chinensis TaxID=2912247 RepID=A0ABS9HYN8_9GAMM|nr:hypothetical protein [Lysobacter chinensis]